MSFLLRMLIAISLSAILGYILSGVGLLAWLIGLPIYIGLGYWAGKDGF